MGNDQRTKDQVLILLSQFVNNDIPKLESSFSCESNPPLLGINSL